MKRQDLIFRVFVSSPFSDMTAERNSLQAKVFPELRKYCQERGARFQAIDLRWGVSEEAAMDQQTMNICKQELSRCQEVSPRPNFIVLFGDRYGWRPLPAQVEAAEFEEIRNTITESDDRTALNHWYQRDNNAVPAEYCLRPVRPEEEAVWPGAERKLRTSLLQGIAQLGWPADDPRRFKYEASATHQEIEAGAFQVENPQDHVFCYFRKIDGLPEDGLAAQYRDIVDGRVDPDAKERLDALKGRLGGNGEVPGILPPERVHTYCAVWHANQPKFDRRDLCADVERDLKRVIDREIAAFKQMPGLDREREAHREFAGERCRRFVGRQDVLLRIGDYIVSTDDTHPLVIHGRAGSGKTAIMAKAASQMSTVSGQRSGDGAEPSTVDSQPLTLVISRLVGATPGSSDLRTLLGDVCRELGVAEIPQDMNELVRTFRAQLSTEQAGDKDEQPKQETANPKKIVLFLDALDQLNPTDNARMLYWMPRTLKPNVKLVISVLETEPKTLNPENRTLNTSFRDDPFDIARRIWPESLVEVGPLDGQSGAELLNAWLEESCRKLEDVQRQEVLAKFARCPLPLYLKLATEQARRWKSWDGVPVPLSDSVEGILEQLLTRLERPENHGATLVSQSLGYIATGKNGLTEDELLDVLSADKTVLDDFIQRSPTERAKPEAERLKTLPVLVWSRLFADIQPYMTRRRADGTVVMDFYHRQVGEAVRKRYLTTDDARIQAHQHLAEYFHRLDYWAELLEAQRARAKRLPPTPRPANVRKVVELPFHRLEVAKLAGKDDPKSPHWDAVADLLTNWQFLEAKAEADPNFREQESVEPSATSGEAKP